MTNPSLAQPPVCCVEMFILQVKKWTGTEFIIKSSFHNYTQFCIQEEIKSKLNLGNASIHSAQNLPSSRLHSKNLYIKIYKNTLSPVVLYGCGTWSLALREELTVFVNRVLRR
jgi:hypothetical protein